MGLPDTSPVPKKDPMGMDYIAVYEGEQDDEPASANQIKISTEKVQKLGVRTSASAILSRPITQRQDITPSLVLLGFPANSPIA